MKTGNVMKISFSRDYAQGKEDSSTLQTNVVVNNVFQMEQTGQFTKPEPKELSLN
jgi:hypothetical protein